VSTAAISVHELEVTRGGRFVLHRVSLDVEAGSMTGLLGPSGCGKTTLMRSIVGVQRISGGEIGVLGVRAGDPALRRRVGYVTQAPSVYGDLSVAENLEYFARILDVPAARVTEVTGIVRLDGHERQVAGSLSGGELARLSLASALLGAPEVLVLDEPTVGLDPVLRDELWRTFRDLAAAGTTLLVSSHVMDEASECDVLALMRDGSLLAKLTPAELRKRTGEPDLARAFLAIIREQESAG
jgi:ABC-2 type transport system ATP-binding protein